MAKTDRENLEELLTLIIHEDLAHVVGGARELDQAAFRILKELDPKPGEPLAIYLDPSILDSVEADEA